MDDARNPSHVYARILRKAIQKHLVLDDLLLSDVLISLRNAGYLVDRKSGLVPSRDMFGELDRPVKAIRNDDPPAGHHFTRFD